MRSTGTSASTDGQGPPDDNPYNELLLSISAFQADTSRLCLSVSVVAAPPAAAASAAAASAAAASAAVPAVCAAAAAAAALHLSTLCRVLRMSAVTSTGLD